VRGGRAGPHDGHDARDERATKKEKRHVETAIGIALVVISALEIFFIVRIVSANLRVR